uniref:GOLD domain-containing protein n=1 Tax=Ditylenchus dipsaci TaxID=166011 RepID=A0A915DUA6_9BILA
MVGTAKFTKTNNLRHLLAYSSFKNYLLVTNNCYLLPSTSNFIFNPTRFLRTKIPKEEEKNASEAEKNAQTKSFGGGFQEELIKELRKDYYYAVNPSPSAKHETLDSKKFDEIRTKVISRLIEKGKNGHLKYLGEDFRKDLVTVHKKIGMERIEKSLSSVLYFILGGLLYKLYTYYAKWNVSKAQDQFTFHLNDPAVNFDDFASAYLADSSVKQIIHYSAQKKAVALLDSEPPSAAENYMSMQVSSTLLSVTITPCLVNPLTHCYCWTALDERKRIDGTGRIQLGCAGCHKIRNAKLSRVAKDTPVPMWVAIRDGKISWEGTGNGAAHFCSGPKERSEVEGNQLRRSVIAEIATGSVEKPCSAVAKLERKFLDKASND